MGVMPVGRRVSRGHGDLPVVVTDLGFKVGRCSGGFFWSLGSVWRGGRGFLWVVRGRRGRVFGALLLGAGLGEAGGSRGGPGRGGASLGWRGVPRAACGQRLAG